MALKCLCCKLLFSVPQLHHDHYKTEWHKYNLKRQLSELPPLSKEEYEKRLAAFKESEEEKNKKVSVRCESCNKHFSTKNAMENHLKSKKHLEVEMNKHKQFVRKETKIAAPVKDKIIKDTTKTTDALISNDAITSSAPMEVEGSDGDEGEWEDDGEWEDEDESGDENESSDKRKIFIGAKTPAEGNKIGESSGENSKIVIDTNDCLFCDHVSDSTESNVSHMTVAHSFFIPDIEYLNDLDGLIATLAEKIHGYHLCLWCDRKTKGLHSVKSVKQHMLDKGHTKMLYEEEAMFDYDDFYDYGELPEEENVLELDEFFSDAADYELVLPSGSTIGHRSLAPYYKQNLKPLNSNSKQKVKKVLNYYQSLGYSSSTSTQIAIKRARDISYVKRMKDKYNLKLGMKQNKILQPHFRNQVLF